MMRVAFMTVVEPAAFHQPAEGACYHPAPGLQDEALGLVAAFDDLQAQPALVAGFHSRRLDNVFELPRRSRRRQK